MLDVEACAAAYGEHRVFRGVTFSVAYGQTAAVVGPSGCGKSTLLAVLAGIKRATDGAVALDDAPPCRGDRRIGLILQHYGLFPWMTVFQNVALGLRFRKVEPSLRREIVARELSLLDIAEYRERYPMELSGGQQQRVAIARTFAIGPKLLLMDEPFSALDTLTREHIQDALVRRLNGGKVITVFVTHSIEEAVYLGQRVLVFGSGGEGLRSLPNEHRIEPGFRMRPLFARRCREVRRLLEDGADA